MELSSKVDVQYIILLLLLRVSLVTVLSHSFISIYIPWKVVNKVRKPVEFHQVLQDIDLPSLPLSHGLDQGLLPSLSH